MEWLPIEYGEFWDVPRMVLVRVDGRLFYLDCPFDRAADEYPDHYAVYELPPDHHGFREGVDWSSTPQSARFIGQLPLSEVEFDATRRRSMISAALRDLLV